MARVETAETETPTERRVDGSRGKAKCPDPSQSWRKSLLRKSKEKMVRRRNTKNIATGTSKQKIFEN